MDITTGPLMTRKFVLLSPKQVGRILSLGSQEMAVHMCKEVLCKAIENSMCTAHITIQVNAHPNA